MGKKNLKKYDPAFKARVALRTRVAGLTAALATSGPLPAALGTLVR